MLTREFRRVQPRILLTLSFHRNVPTHIFSSNTSSIINDRNVDSKNQLIDKFGRPLPPLKGEYYVPSLTCDAVVLRQTKKEVLMITRKGEPFKGCLAFPGGFVDYNEDPAEGCLRELKEETGLSGNNCNLLTVRGTPERDPREHIVSIFYTVQVDDDAQPIANDDAAEAKFYHLSDLISSPNLIAFDHFQVLVMLQNHIKNQ